MSRKPKHFDAAVLGCKLAHTVKRLQKSGASSFPGSFAMHICEPFLEYAAQGVRSVLVCGTNGKTTVTRMLSHILSCCDVPNFSNRSGANMLTGIATAYGMNRKLCGGVKKTTAVIECDELDVEAALAALKPEVLLICNISDDQIYRLKGPGHVTELLARALSNQQELCCCINGGDPFCQQLLPGLICKNIEFSLSGEGAIRIGGRDFTLDWQIPGRYNLENAAAAICAASVLGIEPEQACRALQSFRLPFGRMERIRVGNADVTLSLIKNPAGAAAVINTLCELGEQGSLILAINDSHVDDKDLCWLSSLDYGAMKAQFEPIFLWGSCAEYIRERFLDTGSVISGSCLESITRCEGPMQILANYSAMMEIRGELAQQGYVQDFWKD